MSGQLALRALKLQRTVCLLKFTAPQFAARPRLFSWCCKETKQRQNKDRIKAQEDVGPCFSHLMQLTAPPTPCSILFLLKLVPSPQDKAGQTYQINPPLSTPLGEPSHRDIAHLPSCSKPQSQVSRHFLPEQIEVTSVCTAQLKQHPADVPLGAWPRLGTRHPRPDPPGTSSQGIALVRLDPKALLCFLFKSLQHLGRQMLRR